MATYEPEGIYKDGNNYKFRDSTKIPLAGTSALAGSIVPSTDNSYNLGSSTYGLRNIYANYIFIGNDIKIESSKINKTSNSGYLTLRGGTNYSDGASINLYGKDYNGGHVGSIEMKACTSSDYTTLDIYPNGTMSVYNNSTATTKNIAMQEDTVPRSGGNVITSNVLGRTVDDDALVLEGGNGVSKGGYIALYGYLSDYSPGSVELGATNSNVAKAMFLYPDGSWTWSGTACVVSSDRRIKDEINSISDEVLNAWENLEPKQYKYKSDLETDKENAQIHYGWIAQDVESVIKGDRKGEVKNGLWLHEEWEEQAEVSHEEEYQEEVQTKSGETETVTKTRKVIDTPYKAKGDSYGLRYTECLVVECAYLRKKLKELTARLEKLENNNLK